MPRNNAEPLPRSSVLSLKCALALLPLGHPGLPSRSACVLLVSRIAMLPAEIQGHVCEELLEGQLVPYLFCEETEADAAS